MKSYSNQQNLFERENTSSSSDSGSEHEIIDADENKGRYTDIDAMKNLAATSNVKCPKTHSEAPLQQINPNNNQGGEYIFIYRILCFVLEFKL